MRFRLGLRARVALGFAALGAAVCLAIAVGLDLAADALQQRLLQDILTAEMQEAQEGVWNEPSRPLASTATLDVYVLPGSDLAAMPPILLTLPLGFSEARIEGTDFAIFIEERLGRRFFVVYDKTVLTRHEDSLHLFLTVGVGVMALFSALGGRWLADKVLAPVIDLARRVAALGPGQRPGDLAAGFANDEVGELARAVESHTNRLAEAVEREQSFTGDVSHELRNPLAVVQGAVDVLCATPLLPDSALRPLDRIRRATASMVELSDVLLGLARTPCGLPGPGERVAVEELAGELVEGFRETVRGKPVSLELRVAEPLCVAGDRGALRILLGNLMRNACFHTRKGRISVVVDALGVEISDTGEGMAPEHLERALHAGVRSPAARGAGIGLSLARRLCERNGWRLSLESEQGRGTRARIDLTPISAGPVPSEGGSA